MDDLDRFVPNVHFEKIPIKNLVSNQDYQRNLSQAHIEKTAENFDIFQINPVKVSRRDGINYVFNGQHTIEFQIHIIDPGTGFHVVRHPGRGHDITERQRWIVLQFGIIVGFSIQFPTRCFASAVPVDFLHTLDNFK